MTFDSITSTLISFHHLPDDIIECFEGSDIHISITSLEIKYMHIRIFCAHTHMELYHVFYYVAKAFFLLVLFRLCLSACEGLTESCLSFRF